MTLPMPGRVNYTERCRCGAQLAIESTAFGPVTLGVIEGFRSEHRVCREPLPRYCTCGTSSDLMGPGHSIACPLYATGQEARSCRA